MHMVHALGQEMSMEACFAPHLFEESKNFLRKNLPNHMNNQKPRETEGQRGWNLLVFVDLPSCFLRTNTGTKARCTRGLGRLDCGAASGAIGYEGACPGSR